MAKYPLPDLKGRTLKYGTAGFHEKAEILDSTFFRMGMLALMRSRKLEKTIGLMVTASHNAEPDNGIKMVDPDGGMLDQAWEVYAVSLANAEPKDVAAVLDDIIAKEDISLDKFGSIFIGKDTRPSSEHLSELAREGALMVLGNVLDFGLQTTPQLHHIVRQFNVQKTEWASEDGYYAMLAEAYINMCGAKIDTAEKRKARGAMLVDAAFGVGGDKMPKMAERLKEIVDCTVINKPSDDGQLNHECGAEYVQKGRMPPANTNASMTQQGERIVSFDGDADRVVFSYFDEKNDWHLLDGDKIAALIAVFLKKQLACIGLEVQMAAVQTAYANGASGKYIKSQGVEVPLAKTGVKFVHHKAMEYEIGLYFEANGHGTVVFKDHVMQKIRDIYTSTDDAEKKDAAKKLLDSYQLINQAVGDAISDSLIVEAILTLQDMSVKDWDAIYDDLPSRQTKLQVADRTVVIVTEDESQVIEPKSLQDAIDGLTAKYTSGRAFVRPSGTEDVVRVYAEADTVENADQLALEVANAAFTHAGGVGAAPTGFAV